MAHEGNHEFIDLVLGIMNLIMAFLAGLFLIKLIRIYKTEQKEQDTLRMMTMGQQSYNDSISFSYQSNLSGITSDTNIKETKYVKYFSVGGISCVCIAGLSGFIFYSETYFSYQSTLTSAAFESIHELFWNLGEIACYLLFVDRLKFGFKNTDHKISEIQFKIFWIVIAIYLLCVITFCLYEFNSVSSMFYTTDVFSWIYVFGIELIDFLIGFWLIFLFCKKLLHITVDINQSSQFFMNNLSDKSSELLNKITKYCVLCITAIASTQFVNIFQVIIFLIIDNSVSNDHDEEGNNNNELVIISIHRAFMTVDMFINVLCLFLTTNYSDKYYDKFCSGWHNCIKNCCDKASKSQTMRRRQNKALELALLDEDSIGY